MLKRQIRNALLLPLLAFAGAACAETPKYETPGFEAAFYIAFDAEGEVVVLDSEGNRLKVEDTAVKIPEPSLIKRATQISTLEIQGSHYYLLYINGRVVKIPLPH